MKKSMAVVASIVLLIVALGGSAAHAQEPTVWIWAACDGCTYEVTTADVIVFNDGWAAGTPGLLKEYLKASHTSLVLTNDETHEGFSLSDTQIAGLYGAIGHGPPDEVMWWPGLACPMPNLYYNDWQYVVGSLPAGHYTLVETWTLGHPVNDVFHTCTAPDEDGNIVPITPPPSLYWPGTTIATVHIVVSAG